MYFFYVIRVVWYIDEELIILLVLFYLLELFCSKYLGLKIVWEELVYLKW